jgi:hypothetical protein
MTADWLPAGLTEADVILWGAALVGHPGEYGEHTFSYFAVGRLGVDRMAATLAELMDQRARLLAKEGPECWVVSARAPAVLWWPTPGVRARHGELAGRITADGARLAVYLYPTD